MQQRYFLSSHCVEKSVSLEIFMINYSSKNCVKENTSLNCCVIFYL
jgi:hypothetical protein